MHFLSANEETQKKTVTPQDVLSALSEIEFDSFRPRIEKELAAYTAAAAQKRKSKKDGKGSAVAKSTQGAPTGIAAGDGADESEPEAKRLKRDGMQEGGGASVKASMKNGVDDDETELEDGDEHNEEGREEDEEEEEEDEEEGHADEDATQLEDELEAADSDTTRRRRNPDMDSDLDSDSD